MAKCESVTQNLIIGGNSTDTPVLGAVEGTSISVAIDHGVLKVEARDIAWKCQKSDKHVSCFGQDVYIGKLTSCGSTLSTFFVAVLMPTPVPPGVNRWFFMFLQVPTNSDSRYVVDTWYATPTAFKEFRWKVKTTDTPGYCVAPGQRVKISLLDNLAGSIELKQSDCNGETWVPLPSGSIFNPLNSQSMFVGSPAATLPLRVFLAIPVPKISSFGDPPTPAIYGTQWIVLILQTPTAVVEEYVGSWTAIEDGD